MRKLIIGCIILISACGIFKSNKIMNGSVSESDLKNNKNIDWFKSVYANYTPNKEVINQLKPLHKDLKVLIIAGAWCGDTQRELPRFFKLANEIGMPDKNIATIMVDESKETKAFNVSVLEVKNIPTFIFFKDGKEVGRIIEKPKVSLESDLAELLKLM
jgi:thiol-disulfide isomerase/thioredoxin